MPAAHTAERATRSQRGTDTRSRTGAAILPRPSASARDARPAPPRPAHARPLLIGPPRTRALPSLAERAGAPRIPLPSLLSAGHAPPPPPLAPDVAPRDDVTSGLGGGGGGAVVWRPLAAAGSSGRVPSRCPPPAPPGSRRKMGFSSRVFPQIRDAGDIGRFPKMREKHSRLSEPSGMVCSFTGAKGGVRLSPVLRGFFRDFGRNERNSPVLHTYRALLVSRGPVTRPKFTTRFSGMCNLDRR